MQKEKMVIESIESIEEINRIVNALLEARQNIDPASKAYTFLTYSIDNANRAITTFQRILKE